MMKNKLTIGIPGWKVGDNSFGVTSNYLEWVAQFGNPYIIMPHENFAPVNALVLPGGADVNPSSYGQAPGYKTTNTDVHKQYFYDNCLGNYIQSNVPIFGICLGMQELAVFFKSRLSQDMPWHEQSDNRWKPAHDIMVISQNFHLKYEKPFKVNSHHHQAVLLEHLGEVLIPVATASNEFYDMTLNAQTRLHPTMIVEAIKHKDYPIAGVQWHPEEFYDDFSTQLFKSILPQ